MAATLTSACVRRGGFENLMDRGVCDPDRGSFSTEIDNPYLPMPVGQRVELRDDGGLLVRITVLDQVETVADVKTRVVEEYEAVDGRALEVSRNYFAQARREPSATSARRSTSTTRTATSRPTPEPGGPEETTSRGSSFRLRRRSVRHSSRISRPGSRRTRPRSSRWERKRSCPRGLSTTP